MTLVFVPQEGLEFLRGAQFQRRQRHHARLEVRRLLGGGAAAGGRIDGRCRGQRLCVGIAIIRLARFLRGWPCRVRSVVFARGAARAQGRVAAPDGRPPDAVPKHNGSGARVVHQHGRFQRVVAVAVVVVVAFQRGTPANQAAAAALLVAHRGGGGGGAVKRTSGALMSLSCCGSSSAIGMAVVR